MAFNINTFRSNGLTKGGVRPSQFEVLISPPFSSTAAPKIQLLVSAASLPAFYTEAISVPYFGRQTKYAGDRTFDNWTVNVMNDEDFPVRAIFEKWNNAINTLVSNRLDPSLFPTGYKQDAQVIQYGKSGNVLRSYTFVGLWPMSLSSIQLDWNDGNRIETFETVFCLDYFYADNQTSASDTYSETLPDDNSVI